MKAIVVYRSKSGFVKRYAEWIAEELHADLVEGAKADPKLFALYDAVVYGGGLYATGINGIELITRNMEILKGRKIAVFATGASPARPEAMDYVITRNFSPEQLKQIKFFYLRGGFDYSRLTAMDKVMMTLMKWKIKWKKLRKKPLVADEVGMLAAYERPVDFVKRKNIGELVEYMR